MANNCHQTLIIKGNQINIQWIISRLTEDNEYIRFSNIIPIPSDEKLKELQLSKSEWCEKKYEPDCDFGILHGTEITENQGILEFHTRNSPCRQFVFQLCQIFKYENFYLSFNEPYGGFRGHIECENGEVLEEEYFDKDFERELSLEEIDILHDELKGTNFYHYLTLSGDTNTLKEISSRIEYNDQIVKFSSLIPTPSIEELAGLKISLSNWFEMNYGSKRDYGLLFSRIELSDNLISINFYTEDSPCRELLFKLSQVFKNVEFHTNFGEVSGKIGGTFRCKNGKVIYSGIEDECGYAIKEQTPSFLEPFGNFLDYVDNKNGDILENSQPDVPSEEAKKKMVDDIEAFMSFFL